MKLRAIIVVGLALAIGIWLFKSPPDIFSSTNISGTIDLNGPVPAESTISIEAQEVGKSQFHTVVADIAPKDGATWTWAGAKKGESYQIKASLDDKNGNHIASSQAITVSSPATGEVLIVNVHAPTENDAEISGTLGINGIPTSNTTVSIMQRISSNDEFEEAQSGIKAKDGEQWSWKNAQEGQTYQIKAVAQVNQTYVTESQVVTVSAPAANEVLHLQFVRPTVAPQPGVPTPTPAGISGNINLNGSIPANSSISLGQRITGQSTFSIVQSNVAASNGVLWNWVGASGGQSYDMQAYLINNGQNIASSNIVTAVAPAANETLTINYGSGNLPVPPQSPGVYCMGQGNPNNNWNANISYHSVNGAQNYWIMVKDSNGNQVYSNQIPPNSQQLPTTYNFNTQYLFQQGQTYYVSYAYSTCGSCNQSWNFSPFTQATQFSCNTPSATPNPTNTPVPTNTPAATNTPTPSRTPTPSLPPNTSGCNQTCGSNGYSCVVGLQCVSGDLPGSQVCRNPNCTAQTDCNCNN